MGAERALCPKCALYQHTVDNMSLKKEQASSRANGEDDADITYSDMEPMWQDAPTLAEPVGGGAPALSDGVSGSD